MKFYRLNRNRTIEEIGISEFAHGGGTQQIAFDRMPIGAKISTVFTGIDMRVPPSGDPLLFETMVFGGKLDQQRERCSTIDQAHAQHSAMVERVESEEK